MDQIQPQVKSRVSPKDFFLYLGATLSLYFGTIAFLGLIFDIVNTYFPDQIQYYYSDYASAIRFEIASLIIIFPIFLGISFLINRELKMNPEKAVLWIRKWLTYLTLFIAGITIGVSLIYLINTFLNGEITTRFILKVLATLVTAGGIFGYYFYDLKKDGAQTQGKYRKVFSIVSAMLVLASIVTAFIAVGSPFTQRQRTLDLQRIYDLQNIQSQVIGYWQRKGLLPENLAALKDPLSSSLIPAMDQEGKMYTYERTGEKSFALCAEFDLPGSDMNGRVTPSDIAHFSPGTYPNINQNWLHSSGHVCFPRAIDTQLYPVFKNNI